MVSDWEERFSSWSRPPGDTEQSRIENAIRAIRAALDDDDSLRDVTRVFVQGSYRNRVNVRQDSDVDIGVLYTSENLFGVKYPDGKEHADFGNVPATYSYREFKDQVGLALVRRFGQNAVHRGNKAFDVHENTYRVDTDVVPLIVHRRYSLDGSYLCGVQLEPDNGPRIINWPERLYDEARWPSQHYENGISKNTATKRAYKGVVRILKTLRNEMEAGGVASADPVAGFTVECLVWNAPNSCFEHSTWDEVVQAVLLHLWSNTKTDVACNDWREVSELKYLFRGSPSSKREEAYAFVDEAWSYVGVRGIS